MGASTSRFAGHVLVGATSCAALLGALAPAVGGAVLSSALSGCGTGSSGAATTSASAPAPAGRPTFRLVLLSNVAGALEPCGCSKDQLGGADHLAAFLASQRSGTKSLVLGAGPLFFQEPRLDDDRRTQDGWKAEALADTMSKLELVAWAPGANDWAAGREQLDKLRSASGAAFLGANLRGDSGIAPSKLVEIEGVRVGIVGLSEPLLGKEPPSGLTLGPSLEAARAEVDRLRAEGARLVVVLAAMQRGEALRLVDELPTIDVLAVGKPSEKGDANDQPKPPVMVGDTLVVETSNHLQTVALVDVFVREPAGSSGRIKLADAGGVARSEQLLALSQQIRELENRVNAWEKDQGVRSQDLANRKAELERLRRERSQLETASDPVPAGSFFKLGLVEVRDSLGQDKAVGDVILGYYKRVNDHNRVAFKDRKPVAPVEGKATYVGIEDCTTCHAEERAVWDKTAHAKAYATLEKQFVEFNLDCVSCHVTGYERPGGSTVTSVEKLRNVQCEVCHGPGSLHSKEPEKKGLITVKPDPKTCVAECHHPPHVEGFDPVAKMVQVLGPGHGL